jgi:hypothetical protein
VIDSDDEKWHAKRCREPAGIVRDGEWDDKLPE